MKAIRFRCPKCRALHPAVAARAGQAFVCPACFGPIVVPEAAARPSSRARARTRAAAVGAIVAAAGIAIVATRADRVPPPPRAQSPDLALAPTAPAPFETLTSEPAPMPVFAAIPEPARLPAPEAKVEDPRVEAASPPSPPTGPDRPLVIRRRQTLGQDALRRQLAGLPELTVEERTEVTLLSLHRVAPPAKAGANRARGSRQPRGGGPAPVAQAGDATPPRRGMRVSRAASAPSDLLAMLGEVQPDLTALPWRMGDDCHLDREAAEGLQENSRTLRALLVKSTPPSESWPDAVRLRDELLGERSGLEPQAQGGPAPTPSSRARLLTPAAIPALGQLLMAERTPARLVLADVLAVIPGPEAARALARLACFDLAPEVRERALLALRARAAEESRPTLLEGFRYPWAPVADHAAEALVALGDREAVPALVELLDRPDPERPRIEVRDGRAVPIVRTLVQVNHLKNCVLCHAPSARPTADLVRGRVPDDTQPLPPAIEYYANASPGLFVRAEITYLRQDFSVTQPVEDPGPWPAHQRYDYLVAERPALTFNTRGHDSYPQRESVLFALRELTGKDLGDQSGRWKLAALGR